ncbi:hypothetical protein TUM17567_22610 [Citrobacter amalonaticus]|nr:hypothetical protein TUM17567_22610 [Citrobacter amalonaticus]
MILEKQQHKPEATFDTQRNAVRNGGYRHQHEQQQGNQAAPKEIHAIHPADFFSAYASVTTFEPF